MDPVVFPLPQYSLTPEKVLDGTSICLHSIVRYSNCVIAEIPGLPAHSFPLEQDLQIGIVPATRPSIAVEDPSTASSNAELSPSVLDACNQLKVQVSKREYGHEVIFRRRTGWKKDSAEYDRLKRLDDTSIIPLGTSGGGANPYRNGKSAFISLYLISHIDSVPSTLIRIPGWGSILLDCGEGTWGQLARQFGTDGVYDVLRDLRCIFISQMSMDYHGGLASLLAMRQKVCKTFAIYHNPRSIKTARPSRSGPALPGGRLQNPPLSQGGGGHRGSRDGRFVRERGGVYHKRGNLCRSAQLCGTR